MTTLERLYAEALELSDHDRAILADLLLGSTEAAQDELSPAWKAEIARRLKAIDEGTASFTGWNDMKDEFLAPLNDAAPRSA